MIDTKYQIHTGAMPEESMFRPITNTSYVKADGGLWTSTHIGNGNSGWTNYCEESYRSRDISTRWLLTVKPNAKLLVIDTLADLLQAYEKYPSSKSGNVLDYEKMSQDYDGIHLTEEGLWRTRLTFPINLCGWDCESTHWFRWAFEKVERIRVK